MKLYVLILLVIPIIFSCSRQVNSELFTSIFQMKHLVSTSNNLTEELEAYFEKNYLNNQNTKRLFKNFNQLNQKAMKDHVKFIGNCNQLYILKSLNY